MKHITGYFFILILFASCGALPTNSSHDKLIKYQDEGYKIYLNSEPIDIKRIFLDSNNISKIIRDKKHMRIDIQQYDNSTKYTYCSDYDSKNGSNGRFAIIIVDGFLIEQSDFNDVKIENSAIKETKSINKDMFNQMFDRQVDRNVLIVTTSNKR